MHITGHLQGLCSQLTVFGGKRRKPDMYNRRQKVERRI